MPFYLGRNPKATRRSIIAWAISGAVFGGAMAYCVPNSHWTADARYWMFPFMSAAGAAIAALVEWTHAEDDDE